jgi:hypothetical protein
MSKFIKELVTLTESAGVVYGLLVAQERGEDLDDLDVFLFSSEEKRDAKLEELANEAGYDSADEAFDSDDNFARCVHAFEKAMQ